MPLGIYSNKTFQDNHQLKDEYAHALKMYWQGKTSEVVDFVSETILNQPGGKQVFQFYRLWIELLAQNNEMDGLQDLKKHIFVRGYERSDADRPTWLALRGLIHLELDEPQAAKLIARSVEQYHQNPYCLEFIQKMNLRSNQSTDNLNLSLLQSELGTTDYCHWETYTQGLFIKNDFNELNKALRFVNEKFQSAPLKDLYEMHMNIEDDDLFGAIQACCSLLKKSDTHDHRVISAYLQYRSQNYESCIEELTHLDSYTLQHDADAQLLLGYAKMQIAKRHSSKYEVENAIDALLKAEKLLNEHGHNTNNINRTLQEVEEQKPDYLNQTVHDMDERPIQAWMIQLSQSQYHQMATGNHQDIESLTWSMGAEAQPGDLVFFACESPMGNSKSWRIISIYNVSSKPHWHSTDRYQNSMDLVYRMQRSLEIDIQMVDDEDVKSSTLPYEEPYRFGVFNLESGAIDVITETIKQRNDESDDRVFDLLSNIKISA